LPVFLPQTGNTTDAAAQLLSFDHIHSAALTFFVFRLSLFDPALYYGKMAGSLHESYMRLCLKLAGIARERGEVPVGSVIVRDGAVIAEGIEGVRAQLDVAHHAEMEAIRRTCQILQTLDLSECTLYTSAEPCFMCSYAIRACRISTVVFGAPVNAVGGSSSHFPVLSTSAVPSWGPPPKIVQGILREECEATRNIPQHIPKL
jgi:tRNA(adenine34) deaminase